MFIWHFDSLKIKVIWSIFMNYKSARIVRWNTFVQTAFSERNFFCLSLNSWINNLGDVNAFLNDLTGLYDLETIYSVLTLRQLQIWKNFSSFSTLDIYHVVVVESSALATTFGRIINIGNTNRLSKYETSTRKRIGKSFSLDPVHNFLSFQEENFKSLIV